MMLKKRSLAAFAACLLFVSSSWAAPTVGRFPTPEEGEDARESLNANFEAFNYENAAKLAATIEAAGSREEIAEFQKEAQQLFDDADVYLRIAHFEPFWIEADKKGRVTMLAIVVQHTICKYDNDVDTTEYRTYSALLPPHEFSYYQQEFVWQNGAWKVGAIKTKPSPVPDPAENPPDSVIPLVKAWAVREEKRTGKKFVSPNNNNGRPNCKDGKCSTPFVRVNVR